MSDARERLALLIEAVRAVGKHGHWDAAGWSLRVPKREAEALFDLAYDEETKAALLAEPTPDLLRRLAGHIGDADCHQIAVNIRHGFILGPLVAHEMKVWYVELFELLDQVAAGGGLKTWSPPTPDLLRMLRDAYHEGHTDARQGVEADFGWLASKSASFAADAHERAPEGEPKRPDPVDPTPCAGMRENCDRCMDVLECDGGPDETAP